MKKFILNFIPGLFLLFTTSSCGLEKEHVFFGNTMGTTYHIKVVSHGLHDPSHLKEKITARLEQVNRSMSTYIKDSEISRFNQNTEAAHIHHVSADFLHVMGVSENLFQLTHGAWDGTIKPLVDAWGFSQSRQLPTIPDPLVIKEALAHTGFDKITIAKDGLMKEDPLVTLDLASIAKGFGVDAVAGLIRENGYTDFIVEIGGEVYASGLAKGKIPWRIGINTPDQNAPFDGVYKAVDVENKAVATSGDYRNFQEVAGKRYSHILDPRTGYPVDNAVVSVTIMADTCTFADGLATAVMVMGVNDGMALINRLDATEGLIITRDNNGAFMDHVSSGFFN